MGIAIEHTAPDTHVMDKGWKVLEGANGEWVARSIIGQPHIWEQVLLYMATSDAPPPVGLAFDGNAIGGVLEALREEQRSK